MICPCFHDEITDQRNSSIVEKYSEKKESIKYEKIETLEKLIKNLSVIGCGPSDV